MKELFSTFLAGMFVFPDWIMRTFIRLLDFRFNYAQHRPADVSKLTKEFSTALRFFLLLAVMWEAIFIIYGGHWSVKDGSGQDTGTKAGPEIGQGKFSIAIWLSDRVTKVYLKRRNYIWAPRF